MQVIPTFDTDLIAELYVELKRQGVTGDIFHQGGGGVMIWIDWLSRRSHFTAVAVEESGRPVGAGWVNSMVDSGGHKIIEVSFAFLKGLNPWDVVRAAKTMLRMAVDALRPNLILGTYPSENSYVGVLARRLGFREQAQIDDYFMWKGQRCPGSIVSMKAEDLQMSASTED